MGPSGKIRIAEQVEIAWAEPGAAAAERDCPNCGERVRPAPLVAIDYRPPDAHHEFTLLVCPACTVRFADNAEAMDYATDELIEIGWDTYQVQLGAGVWPITAPLARIGTPAGAKVLEIGGAYGFGLDFSTRALGWVGVGYDPSPLAAFGARELGLDIRQAYFGEAELAAGPYDVAIATEVVEHLTHPPAFLALMRRAVGDAGVLLLTTPDAEKIAPGAGPGLLVPLLSPGAHVVLQTEASLRRALGDAGFGHVEVVREPMSLVAYASAAPLALREAGAAGRRLYRDYLVARAGAAAPESDLALGFAGRGFFEAVNDGDFGAARQAWTVLCRAARARFGLDLAAVTALPAAARDADLAGLARAMPLGLGMILFGRAMQMLGEDQPRREIEPVLRLAREAVDALQAALAKRSLADGLSGSIRVVIEGELALCAAEAGDPGAVAAIARWVAAQGDVALGWRGFTGLVNNEAYAAAADLRAALGLDWPGEALPADLRAEGFASLANFHLRPGGDAAAALLVADGLRGLGEPADAVVLRAFTRLVNAGRYEAALAAARDRDVAALAAADAGEDGRDAGLSLTILDLAAGDPLDVPKRLQGRLRGLGIPAETAAGLLLDAFVRLVNAARYADAQEFARAEDVAGLAAARDDAVGEDARVSLSILDLAAGDPMDVPGRLEGRQIGEEKRRGLLLDAFVRLVNAARHEEALAFAAAQDVPALAAAAESDMRADAYAALAVLDLAAGDPAAVPARLAAAPGLSAGRREALLFAAFTGLVNAARPDEAEALAAADGLRARLDTATGKAAEDARIAAVLLDFAQGREADALAGLARLDLPEPDRAALLADGFVRLVNAGHLAAARRLGPGEVERRLDTVPPKLRQDALAALIILQMTEGGEAGEVPRMLDAAAKAGVPADRIESLAEAAFVTLVNRGEMAAARTLRPRVNAALAAMKPPFDDGARSLLFASGVLAMGDGAEHPRAAVFFARLRDDLEKHAAGADPGPLFWPALRGEVLVLRKLNRGGEADLLLKTFLTRFDGAPEDLIETAPKDAPPPSRLRRRFRAGGGSES